MSIEDEHDLYKTGDSDAPDTIKDHNGEVVLQLCRKCGRAEAQLVGVPCAPDSFREKEAILNEALANQSPRQLYDRAVRAEAECERQKRRADALERATEAVQDRLPDIENELQRWLMGEAINMAEINEAVNYIRASLNDHPGLAEHPETLEQQGYKARGEPLADRPAAEPDCCTKTRANERERCWRAAALHASEHKRCAEQATSHDQMHIHEELEDLANDIADTIRQGGDDTE